jgi:hypothetical protein
MCRRKKEDFMRYSSIKTLVAALSITLSLAAFAPVASARQPATSRGAETTRAREDSDFADRVARMRELVNRAVRRLASHTTMTVPIPAPTPPNSGN